MKHIRKVTEIIAFSGICTIYEWQKLNFRRSRWSKILRYSPAQKVRSPSYERTMFRKPHPDQTTFPGSYLPGFFLPDSFLVEFQPAMTAALKLVQSFPGKNR